MTVIDRGCARNGRTLVEVVDPPDDVRVGHAFYWASMGQHVLVHRISPDAQPSREDGIVLEVEAVLG